MDKSLRNRISDLLSQINEDTVYFDYNSSVFGNCRLKHCQAKIYLNNKLSTKNRYAPFLEPLDKLSVSGHNLKTSLIDALLDCFGDYVVPSVMPKGHYKIVTPLYSPTNVTIEDVVRCLILWCIATDVDSAIDKLESFSNNDPLKYKEYVVIEGLNISENYNFADFEMMPSNENLGVIPDSLIKQLGYSFWSDRTLLVSEFEFNKAIEKPKVVSADEYATMVRNKSKLSYNLDQKTGKIITYGRSFNRQKNASIWIDILCFAFSLHLKTPIWHSWHFQSLDENHLLYILPNAKFRPTEGSIEGVLRRTNEISIPDNDMAEIKGIYEQTVEIHNIGSEESKDFMGCVKLFMDLQTLPMRLDYNKVSMLGTSFEHLLDGYRKEKIRIPALTNFLSSVDQDNKIGEFYEIRGAFVHANKKKLRDIHNNEQSDEIVQQALEDCRKMLKKCIDERALPSVDKKQRNI